MDWSFLPHGICLKWDTFTILLHLISDIVVALSYFSIPALMFLFARKQSTLPHKNIIALFITFILFCGLTHVMSVFNMFVPEYYSSGIIKALTAIISLYTAIVLAKNLPELVRLQILGIKKDNIMSEIESLQINLKELRQSAYREQNEKFDSIIVDMESLLKNTSKEKTDGNKS